MYMYFINRTDKNPVIYYQEKCHPHPSVRLSYMLVFVLDNLQANVPYPINKNEILKNAIQISEILMKDGEDNIIEEYSKALLKEIKKVEDYIKGSYKQVYKMAKEKGFSGTKGLFWFAIRNPVYCGRIFIPKYKDEESCFVKGSHEPIISEALYYQVQDVLDGRKRHYRLKVVSNESLPLRGFLICPLCNKLLTGSASKGHTKYYSYYHCTDGCSCRYRADNVNNIFVTELKKYIPRPEMIDLFKITLSEAWYDQTNHLQDDSKQLQLQIKELEEKLSYIRELLSSRQLDPADFREMKTEYTTKLEKLQAKLGANNHDKVDFNDLLNKGVNNLLKLDYVYETGDAEKKREVISSMYPEKMTFDGFSVRTNRINEVARLIYSMDVGSSENKNRINQNNSSLSCQVGRTRFELATPRPPDVCATGLRYRPPY